MQLNIKHTVLDRFLRYVKIDTQSDASSPTCPSTEKQFNLAKVLMEELKEMGVTDAKLDKNGYIRDMENMPGTTSKFLGIYMARTAVEPNGRDQQAECSDDNDGQQSRTAAERKRQP